MASAVDRLTDAEVVALYYDWEGTWARSSQRVPGGEWLAWLILAGRGFGKTRCGAEWIRGGAETGCKRMALIGATASDVRDTMVEGESGVLAVSRHDFRPRYEPSKRRIVWPNGAMATCFSADEPDRLRGPQHDRAWCDELAAWRRAREAWDNLMFGLRIGLSPQVIVTTTPKPLRLLRELRDDPLTVVTGGSTYENLENLSPAFRSRIVSKYENTTIGEQELLGRLLDEAKGALWKRITIERKRVAPGDVPDLSRVAVAIDPAVTSGEDSDETGIVCAGLADNGHLYVLADESGVMSPDTWANASVGLLKARSADRIVAETNNGGDLVERVLRTVDKEIPYVGVWASRGKHTRAEPIAALYEQGRVHHVGVLADLEDQMVNWVPGEPSPDRMDALVWCITYLIGSGQGDLLMPSQGTSANRSIWAV